MKQRWFGISLAWSFDSFPAGSPKNARGGRNSIQETNMNEITIEAGRAERQYWRDLWRYRELFYFLAWRDILVRYKQTVIGVAWAVVRPLLTMLVLTFIFGKLAKMPSGGVPYPILVFCGMLPWQFFATAFSESGNSLVSNAGMISKVYFPRLVVPVSSVITSFVDFLISSVLMTLMMVYYGYVPGITIAMLPVFVLLAFATAFGSGLWVSALMVRYRDFRYIVPFVVQFGLYVSPVGFSSNVVPEEWRWLYSINPMVGVIDGFRWAILGEQNIYWPGFLISVVGVILIIISGIWYFRRTERTFADVI
jgi:lipopolysaccharide transport system permease protein